jgi:histone demethylase JARID1
MFCDRYGSEIDCARLCPDFPVNSGGDRYSKSLWNLGRLRDATLLKHLPQPISGVTQPWVYVGMCFSSFCWHNEDMHMYSINYLHEGDEKIWYGASGDDADKFEAAATALFPQLMLMQPDLLCNLVTQIHPQDLVKQGCRIVITPLFHS